MDIAKGAEDGDETLEKDGLKVFLEKKAHSLLSKATMDFVDEQGFVITGVHQSPCCS